jgi:hypothetical protein
MQRVFGAIEAQLDRIDARLGARKARAPGQLDLFGGGAQIDMTMPGQAPISGRNSQKPPAVGRAARGATAREGKPCGDGHISASLTCHKSGSAATPDAQAPPKGPASAPATATAGKAAKGNSITEASSGSGTATSYASPADLSYELALNGHRGTSFDPEKRARSHQENYAAHLNSLYARLQESAESPEQRAILDAEMKAYKDGYTKRYTAWLGAKSRIVSPMIAGPSNFPVRRMEKANRAEDVRRRELEDFTTRAQSSIYRKLQRGRTPEAAHAQELATVTRSIDRSITWTREAESGRTFYDRSSAAASISGKISRLAKNGQVELVRDLLDHLRDQQDTLRKPLFTPRHSVWNLEETARQQRLATTAKAASAKAGAAAADYKSGEIERDFDNNRVRIRFHNGKPSDAIRSQLKGSGWRWSPSNSAWQRMNTENSVYAAKRILQSADEEQKSRGDSIEAIENRLLRLASVA